MSSGEDEAYIEYDNEGAIHQTNIGYNYESILRLL
jgi:hypothetical protein